MTNEEKNKLFEIRCQSKLGKGITEKETKFIQKMYKKYPDEYSAMNKDIFESTKPFGSTSEYKE